MRHTERTGRADAAAVRHAPGHATQLVRRAHCCSAAPWIRAAPGGAAATQGAAPGRHRAAPATRTPSVGAARWRPGPFPCVGAAPPCVAPSRGVVEEQALCRPVGQSVEPPAATQLPQPLLLGPLGSAAPALRPGRRSGGRLGSVFSHVSHRRSLCSSVRSEVPQQRFDQAGAGAPSTAAGADSFWPDLAGT